MANLWPGLRRSRAAVRGARRGEGSEERRNLPAGRRLRRERQDPRRASRYQASRTRGLEWTGTVAAGAAKSPFRLSATAVASVRSALGLPEAAATRDSLSLDQLLAEIAPPGGPVRIVNVSKTRTRYHCGRLRLRAHRRRRERKESAHGRDRGCRRGQGHRGRARHGARPLSKHQLPPRPETGRSASRALAPDVASPSRDRRGNQFGQVSHRRAQTPTEPGRPSSTGRKSPGSAKESSKPARSARRRWSEPPRRSRT